MLGQGRQGVVRLEKGGQPGQKLERVSPHHWRVREAINQKNHVSMDTFRTPLSPPRIYGHLGGTFS